MIIENDLKLDYSDVLIRPKRSAIDSRKDVDLFRTYDFRNSKQTYYGIPIMAANMDTIGTFPVAEILSQHGLFTCLHKHYSVEDWNKNHDIVRKSSIAISTGANEADYNKVKAILEKEPISFICIDVANGYTERFVEFVSQVRKDFPEKVIIAGNVVTGDMTQELILAGADIIKVGIGPGSVCTTRIKTGIGYPQLSAVIECADAAHGLGGHIIADGGCTCPGDVAKAFAGGADFVMLGGMFAGTFETGAKFYGMSSSVAQEKYNGGLKDYKASEGKAVEIPVKGSINDVVQDILGGLRSCCSYTGAERLKDLSKCTTFIRVNNQYNRIFGNS
jgi:GMP reductase